MPQRVQSTAAIVLLAAAAAGVNAFAPSVFFDSQIMLGGGLAVFAVLQYGWAGLTVGLAALAVTVVRWGHPIELFIGMAFLVWLAVFLRRLNGGWHNRDNGRILLAAVVYWLMLGLWLETVAVSTAFDVATWKALGIGLKETVVGLANTTLGFLLFVGLRWWKSGTTGGPLSVRGLTFALLLAAVTVPGIVVTYAISNQLKQAYLRHHLDLLHHAGERFAAARHDPAAPAATAPAAAPAIDVLLERADGTAESSNPDLFAALERDYAVESPSRTGTSGLEILQPRPAKPTIAADRESYWSATFSHGEPSPRGEPHVAITVVQPVSPLIDQLDAALLIPSFAILLVLLCTGIIVGEAVGGAAERQYAAVILPLRQAGRSESLPRLPEVRIRELRSLVAAIAERDRRVMELTSSLNTAREKLARTAFELTENIPVGTYTMVLPPDGGMARFEFMSRRFLELTGLDADVARRNPLDAFACVHPEDREEWIRKNAHAFAHRLPFKEECRLLIGAEIRWILAESTPRQLPDGSTVWEGVLTDITDRKLAARELAAARDRERVSEERMRETLQQKLKTSLTASAVAHEINQPLSRILLRAQMDRAALAEQDDHESLDALIADAERVVLTIQKMNVLLRNVQTNQTPVLLDEIVVSGLIQLKSVLRRYAVTARHTPAPEDCLVLGDDVQLQMIVTNLVRNAAEAIDAAGSSRREVSVTCECDAGTVELVVGDSGPGWPGGSIDEMLLASRKPQGTGIGLYVVKTAVENHGGEIRIGRSPLGGAEFRIAFRRLAGGDARGPQAPARSEDAAGETRADDEE